MDLTKIYLPFDADFKDKVSKILGLNHFEPTQKIQLVFKEVSTEFTRLNGKITSLESSLQSNIQENEILLTKLEKLEEFTDSLLRE
jgi:hypothetical protein